MRSAQDNLSTETLVEPKNPGKKTEVLDNLAKKYKVTIQFQTKRGSKAKNLSKG